MPAPATVMVSADCRRIVPTAVIVTVPAAPVSAAFTVLFVPDAACRPCVAVAVWARTMSRPSAALNVITPPENEAVTPVAEAFALMFVASCAPLSATAPVAGCTAMPLIDSAKFAALVV